MTRAEITGEPHFAGNVSCFPAACQTCPIDKAACPIHASNLNNAEALILSSGNAATSFDHAVILLLAETGRLSLIANGVCMVPAIYPGDKLFITSRPIDQVKIGEIAVFRKNGRLFGHRVIASGQGSSGVFIVTRPDSSDNLTDDPIYSNELVGVICRVERRGKKAPDVEKIRPGLSRAIGKIIFGSQVVLTKTAKPIQGLQASRFYHWLAALARPSVLKNSTITLKTPLRPETNLTQNISGQVVQTYRLKDLQVKDFSLILNTSGELAASMRFCCSPDGCTYPGWWLLDSSIRTRYRELGLEKHLFDHACSLFRKSGVEYVWVTEPPGWLFPISRLTFNGWQVKTGSEYV